MSNTTYRYEYIGNKTTKNAVTFSITTLAARGVTKLRSLPAVHLWGFLLCGGGGGGERYRCRPGMPALKRFTCIPCSSVCTEGPGVFNHHGSCYPHKHLCFRKVYFAEYWLYSLELAFENKPANQFLRRPEWKTTHLPSKGTYNLIFPWGRCHKAFRQLINPPLYTKFGFIINIKGESWIIMITVNNSNVK